MTWDETALLAEIDRMESIVLPIADPTGADGVAAKIQEVRDYVSTRRGLIQTERASGPPAWNGPARGIPCIKTIGRLDSTFNTTWGTNGGNPFATGTGTMSFTLGTNLVTLNPVGSNAGPEPPRPTVAMIGGKPDGRFIIAYVLVGTNDFAPGNTVKLDWINSFGIVQDFDPVSNTATLVGYLTGTITYSAAATVNGQPVIGSTNVEIISPPF